MPLFAILGLFVGSFLNVCIDRLPGGQSIISPRSHCASCHHKLGFSDLLPVFSYLWLRGRCRYCGAAIPPRIPLVEGITSLLFALLFWRFDLSVALVISLIYISLFIVIFAIDLEHMLVLNITVYPAMVLALVLSLFWPGVQAIDLPGGWIVGKLASSLAGGAIGLAAMALPLIIYRRGIGLGDLKLGALVGLMTGYPSVFVALLFSVVSGGLVAALLLAFRVKRRSEPIPFAPFLVTGATVGLLWGQDILKWYLG